MLNMRDLNLAQQRVLIREDLNVPLKDGAITDYTRIERAIPTLQAALQQSARVMVISHLGRPTAGQFAEEYSLRVVADDLARRLDFPVRFASDWLDGVECAPGELVVCENVRFNQGEKSNDPALAKKMAALCDVFVMDAFATAHRAEASTAGVTEFAPKACAGPLLLAEITALAQALTEPQRPLLAIVGGAKVSSKMQVLMNLLDKVDSLIVGGGMANTLLKASGLPVGASLYEPDWVGPAEKFLAAAKQRGIQVPLPTDVVVGTEISDDAQAHIKTVSAVDASDKIFDIGPDTQQVYVDLITRAKTIVWNGPVGVFEVAPYRQGTQRIAEAVAASSAYSIAGGGDTIAALNKFKCSTAISYISTGGGAFLEFLEGRVLPAVAALELRQAK